jgi:hypothetical protein
MLLNDKTQIAQTLTNNNEEKTIVERIRKLELQVVELHQYLDVEKTKVDSLRDILGISIVHD